MTITFNNDKIDQRNQAQGGDSELARALRKTGDVLTLVTEITLDRTVDQLAESMVRSLRATSGTIECSDVIDEPLLMSGQNQNARLGEKHEEDQDEFAKRAVQDGLSKSTLADLTCEVSEIIQQRMKDIVPPISLRQATDIPRNSRDHRLSYHWSVPGGSGVRKLYRPLFDPRSTINTAIYKAEKSRKDEIVNSLIQSAHVAKDHISSTITNAESKERSRQLKDGPATWLLKTRIRSDISDMILQKYQKGLSGLDDPSGLSFAIGWEYNDDEMRDDSDILLRYIDKHDTDQGWFADIQAPRPINLSELPLDQIMD